MFQDKSGQAVCRYKKHLEAILWLVLRRKLVTAMILGTMIMPVVAGAVGERAAVKAVNQNMRDEKKKSVVVRFNLRMTEMNQKAMRVFGERLEKMRKAVDRVSDATSDQAVREAIIEARAAIAQAQEAINTQADKVYVVDTATDATAGYLVRGRIAAMKRDILEVRKTVIEARHTTVEAMKALAASRGGS